MGRIPAQPMRASFSLRPRAPRAWTRGQPGSTTTSLCWAAPARARRATSSSRTCCNARAPTSCSTPRGGFSTRWARICASTATRSIASTSPRWRGRSATIRSTTCAGAGAGRSRRTSSASRARCFPAMTWATTRFGRARLPTTSRATSPTSLRRFPIGNGTWPRS